MHGITSLNIENEFVLEKKMRVKKITHNNNFISAQIADVSTSVVRYSADDINTKIVKFT